MKKLILVIAACLIIVSLFTFCSCAVKDNSVESADGMWRYVENGDGTITLTETLGMEQELVIPATVDGKRVSAISEKFFVIINDGSKKKKLKDTYSDNNILEKVVFEAKLTEIPNMAFYLCRKLKDVYFPETLEKIGAFAFYGCSSLEDIAIPKSCNSIGEYAFRECGALKDVYLESEKIVDIGDKCFYMVNEKASGDDQYYIIDGLKIHVRDVDYSIETLEALRKKTRNNSYKYWQEYVKKGVILNDSELNKDFEVKYE